MESNLNRTFGVVAAFGAATLAGADSKIMSITATKTDTGIDVIIRGQGLKNPHVLRAFQHRSLLLDFHGTLEAPGSKQIIAANGVDFIRFAQHSDYPKVARLRIALSDTNMPRIEKTADGYIIHVHESTTVASNMNPKVIQSVLEAAQTMSPIRLTSVPAPAKIASASEPKAPIATAAASITKTAPAIAKTEPITTPVKPIAAKDSIDTLVKVQKTSPSKTSISTETSAQYKNIGETTNPKIATKPTISVTPKNASIPVIAVSNPSVPTVQPVNYRAAKAALATVVSSKTEAQPILKRPDNALDHPVTLDFANTDVVQILKAIALQAQVNIVTAPDVKGAITVALDHVSVKQALDYVTSLAGVRYSLVGSAYLVATPDKIQAMAQQVEGQADSGRETRVVQIYSGQGGQIKMSVQQQISTDAGAKYVLLVPSDNVSSASSIGSGAGAPAGIPGASAAGGAPGAAPTGGASSSSSAPATQKSGKDTYLILVGPTPILDSVEKAVASVDKQLCRSLFLPYPSEEQPFVTKVYHCRANSAKALIATIADPDRVNDLKTQPNRTKYGLVDLIATNTTTYNDQNIVLKGPKDQVMSLMDTLRQVDDPGDDTAETVIYEAKYADPRSLKEDLLAQFPALRVRIAPGPAANQNLYSEGHTLSDAQTQGLGGSPATATSNSASGGQPGSSSSSSSGSSSGSSSSSSGSSGSSGSSSGSSGSSSSGTTNSLSGNFTLPYSGMESNAQPLRLVIKGDPEVIKKAKDYLALVDTAPRQVALEVRIMELTKEDAINAGVDWNIASGGVAKSISLANDSASSTQNNASAHIRGHGWSSDVTAQLDKIANKSNLIARPNLVAIDGRQSELFIGDLIPFVESIQSTQNGVSVQMGQTQVGVRFSVIPRIGDDDTITMDMQPVVSYLTGFLTVAAINGKYPQTSNRAAQLTMTVHSGDTVAIGGLIQDQDRKNVQGLPFLMDLPIVGNLFKRTNNDKLRTELVIFVTAKIVTLDSKSKLPAQPDMDMLNKLDKKK